MALQKSVTIHGVTGEYWQLADKNYSKDSGKTTARLRCYVSAAVRETGLDNFIGMPDFQKIIEADGDLTTAEMYAAAKVSAIVDEVETNIFANAVDC